MISAFRSWPFGSVSVSTCTEKIRPSKTLRISRGTIGLFISVSPAGKIVQHRLEIVRQRCDELETAAVPRMCEDEPRGVEKRPFQPLHRANVASDPPVN